MGIYINNNYWPPRRDRSNIFDWKPVHKSSFGLFLQLSSFVLPYFHILFSPLIITILYSVMHILHLYSVSSCPSWNAVRVCLPTSDDRVRSKSDDASFVFRCLHCGRRYDLCTTILFSIYVYVRVYLRGERINHSQATSSHRSIRIIAAGTYVVAFDKNNTVWPKIFYHTLERLTYKSSNWNYIIIRRTWKSRI